MIAEALKYMPDWMGQSGPEQDVAMLTTLSLSRNSEDFLFPHRLSSADLLPLLSRSDAAAAEMFRDFRTFEGQSPDELYRGVLEEQLVQPQEFSGLGRRLYQSVSDGAYLLLNGEDHFRLSLRIAGFETSRIFARLEALDGILEKHFSYAVSMDFGYLSSRVDRVGDGFRVEVLLHLPALSRSRNFDEVIAHAQREGLSLSGFGNPARSSPGQIFMLSANSTLGADSREILEKLDLVVVEFIHYERQARKELVETGGLEYEDMVWRDYSVLCHSRMLGLRESFELLSKVRLGQGAGVLPASPIANHGGFFLTQAAHIRYLLREIGGDGDENGESRLRAALFRELFSGGQI